MVVPANALITLHGGQNSKLGPAMRKLNERQRLFVWAMLDSPGANQTRAAAAAGYKGDYATISATASRLAHDEDIQAAILEEGKRRLKSGAILATSHLLKIADDPMHKDQLKAIVTILDRTGMHAQSEHKVTVEHSEPTNRKDMIRQIIAECTAQGIDPKKVLSQFNIVDVEFEEVPATTAAVGNPATGPEDMFTALPPPAEDEEGDEDE